MKKILIYVLLFTCLISVVGCTKNTKEEEAMIMVNGKLYTKSKNVIDLDTNSLIEIGKIANIVNSTELPQKNNQANRKDFLNATIFENTADSVILEYNGYTLFTLVN